MQDGDILVYADSGCTVNSGIQDWIALMEDKPMLRFELEHDEKKYTKPDVFEYFQVQPIWKQLHATVFILKKCAVSLQFANDWLRVACDRPDLFTDDCKKRFGLHRHDRFGSHRHDQSIASVLTRTRYSNESMILKDLTLQKNAPILAARRKD
jgi:hypothetical protein